MATYYHGTFRLFEKFDLDHALEGDGKVKFGFGVYVTSKYPSAAHYSGSNPSALVHYVYTVEIPDVTPGNHLGFREPVDASILERASRALGEDIPGETAAQGSLFRKWLANRLTGRTGSVRKMTDRADLAGEKAAAAFLTGIGVDLLTWPTNWNRPEDGLNCAVMDDSKVRMVQVDTVELEGKAKLVEGSQKLVKKF